MDRTEKIEWHSPEHKLYVHGPDWFWVVGILAFGGAVLAAFFDNILFSGLILLAAGVAMLKARMPRGFVYCELSRSGVRVNDVRYPWTELVSFWVIDTEDHDRIIIRPRRSLATLIVIPYESHDVPAETIRNYMLEYLNEEHMEEPGLVKMMERLGF
jgi:hypothetical protein